MKGTLLLSLVCIAIILATIVQTAYPKPDDSQLSTSKNVAPNKTDAKMSRKETSTRAMSQCLSWLDDIRDSKVVVKGYTIQQRRQGLFP